MVVHASVGAMAGNAVSNPMAAFALGFLSHFFLDMVPHGDAHMYDWYKSGKRVRPAIVQLGIDVLLTVVLIAALFILQDFFSPVAVAMGIVGGLMPDMLVGFFELIKPGKRKWLYRKLESFHTLHMKNHCLMSRYLSRNKDFRDDAQELLYGLKFSIKQFRERDIPLRYGLIIQGVMLIACIAVIL